MAEGNTEALRWPCCACGRGVVTDLMLLIEYEVII